MWKFIEKIQSQDKRTRVRWLIILSSISGFLVLGIWTVQFTSDFSKILSPESEVASIDEGRGIWNQFSAGISDTFKQIRSTSSEAYKDIKETVSSSNEINIEVEGVDNVEE